MMNAAQQVWKDKNLPVGLINKEVTTALAATFWEAIEKGYGVAIDEVKFGGEDHQMLEQLRRNVWHFAGAKNYTQLRQIGAAMINPDGTLRNEKAFIEEALKINSTMSKQYLSVEYNLARTGAEMSEKWVDIQKTKSLFPYLEFDAVMDGQTTEICSPLNGVVLPVDDPFWNQYYPPNHYNCRSTVRKKTYGPSNKPSIPSADIPDMFRTNVGKTGFVFPKDHPYFVGIPNNIKKEAFKLMPYDAQFDLIQAFDNGGYVREHWAAKERGGDYNSVITIAKQFGEYGYKVDLMPKINESQKDWRRLIYPDSKGVKNPDLRIDGLLADVKELTDTPSKNTLSNGIDRAYKQANHAVLYLHKIEPIDHLKNISQGKFENPKFLDLQKITYRQPEGELVMFSRSDFEK